MAVAVVQPDDYQALASFMAGFPGVKARSVAAWLSRLRAWWDLNPAFEESFPRGWLIRDDGKDGGKDGGKIGGFFGSLPLKMQLGGQETTAFAATSWRVLPEYRGRSIGLKMRQLEVHKGQLHFSTTPREDLVPLLKRLGYQQIDRGPGTDHQRQFILDGEKFWRFRFRNAALGPFMAKLAAPALAAVQAVRTRGLRASSRDDVREVAQADQAFDDLWRRTRRRFANTNVRTAEMINWYCFAMQPSDKRLLAYYDGATLRGFMVLLTKEEPGRKFIECVDVWIDPAAEEARVLALVAKAVDVATQGAYERVLFPHFDARTAGIYGSLGLLEGPAWKKREYVKGPADLMQSITPDNSYFVRAQGDYGL